MKALGVDPGIQGGIAVVEIAGTVPTLIGAWDIPVAGTAAKERVDVLSLRALINQHQPAMAFIERAQAMPRQGASSGFKYGRATGALEAALALCGLPVEIVESSMWKRSFRLPGKDKEAARQRALLLFPQGHVVFYRKRDHGRAEAALIALFGLQNSRSIVAAPPGAQPGSNTKSKQLDLFRSQS